MTAAVRALLIALATVVVFAAGFFARVWTERQLPLPAPLPPGGEFSAPASGRPVYRGPSRAELAADIERLRPQIQTFRERLGRIDAEFDASLKAILTPAQRERYAERHRHHGGESRGPHAPNTRPLTDQQIMMLRDRPLWNALDHISVQMKAADLAKDLQLDDAQRAEVLRLLVRRRDEFLALVDSVPPPSLMLSGLAPVAQRLAPGSDAGAKQP